MKTTPRKLLLGFVLAAALSTGAFASAGAINGQGTVPQYDAKAQNNHEPAIQDSAGTFAINRVTIDNPTAQSIEGTWKSTGYMTLASPPTFASDLTSVKNPGVTTSSPPEIIATTAPPQTQISDEANPGLTATQ